MTDSNLRRARRADLTVKKRRKGLVYVDPATGQSLYAGNRSSKFWHRERRIEVFFHRRERGGLG